MATIDSEIDDIIDETLISLKTLNLLDNTNDNNDTYNKYEASQRVINYMGWINKPSIQHMSPTLTTQQIINILTDDAILDINYNDIPHIKKASSLPSKIMIQAYKQIELQSTKPNLLIALSSIIYDIIKTSNTNDIDNILSLLTNTIDIVTSRNPIKQIFTYYYDRKDDWIIHVCRPYQNGPIFIERTGSYSVNTGNITSITTYYYHHLHYYYYYYYSYYHYYYHHYDYYE